MNAFNQMTRVLRVLFVLACLALPGVVWAEPDATIFRIFMLDGSSFVSYGEFVKLDDNVIFSMPVGGAPDQPRLQVAMVKTSLVDWPKTDRYSASARYKRYAETRGEEDYLRLSRRARAVFERVFYGH